jgi:probable selenium-dependent hydroxylase accessory protein YqeC
MTSLKKALILDEQGVVSLVGAGGKTSLMFKLAHEIANAGDCVLTTTTTKIFTPTSRQSSHLIISDHVDAIVKFAEDSFKKSRRHITAAAGRMRPQNKLIGFQPQIIDALADTKLFRWIIVEADGAARKPLKAPADHEPVIAESTTLVVGICGLSAAGKALSEKWVHRSERFAEITGLNPGQVISGAAFGDILVHENGIFKNTPLSALRIAFLNQADMPGGHAAGKSIAESLLEREKTGLNRIVIGQIKLSPPVLETYDLGKSSV